MIVGATESVVRLKIYSPGDAQKMKICEPHSEGGIRFPKGKIDGEGGPPLVH